LKHFDYDKEINAYYISQLPSADWGLIEDLEYYWQDSFLSPLVESFASINKNHIKYMRLLDKHHHLWKGDKELQSKLYHQIKEYAHQVLVDNDDLEKGKISGWQSWTEQLSMTHSEEAEKYFLSFFENDVPIYSGNDNLLYRYANAPPYYPPNRVCDVALEAYLHSKSIDLNKIYKSKLDELIKSGAITKSKKSRVFIHANSEFQDRDNMMKIRNAIIQDYL